ncbi:phosphoribosylformylglycinamidine synthase [Candidatus Nitrosacidococcus sp. I8]|uniref:phosphoribosylformylglycinamidine synthase n=1 Tax=Candidatus Nitrosacidococcus sp. I8 TaxID=2942908 RepID=UPI0022261CAF|nr:phosphoribosylformylglycinamidine synthase [Candidatus Nitrosacidococcus sp. I8]
MLQLYGQTAFSSFRLKKLLAQLQDSVIDITSVEVKYFYYCDIAQSLSDQESSQLKQLLEAESLPIFSENQLQNQLIVIPRPGTISSWSSKATDIAHLCGLTKIKRLEKGLIYLFYTSNQANLLPSQLNILNLLIHDRMTEKVFHNIQEVPNISQFYEPRSIATIDILSNGKDALKEANKKMGLALTDDEIDYLITSYQALERNPTDIELMMFAQANSEHCRHKIFNAAWVIENQLQQRSLFEMIRFTYESYSEGILSAYKDNAAVIAGGKAPHFIVGNLGASNYSYQEEERHVLIKVETHNHPTAISPFAGAATGSGGEIRDEGATGQGGKPKAGLAGFSVSNLHIPNFKQPWEINYGKPSWMASALDIMLAAPIGSAAFNNEFGRPNLCGYFRTFEEKISRGGDSELRGYHKPIMIAGGIGNIRPTAVQKKSLPAETPLIVIGGPALLIGLGGGAASSLASGEGDESLDFTSVQRSNPEMQRRCQEVIDRCTALGHENPILSIHDVGAGGLSNALPELVHDSHRGGEFQLREIPSDEPNLSPLEIWCNEAQERYVLAVNPNQIDLFQNICERERCPWAIVGRTTERERLIVSDSYFNNNSVNIPMDLLFGNPPKTTKNILQKYTYRLTPLQHNEITLFQAAEKVLRLPSVASKSFLITIGDRSITGLVARDQMVGPWQVPVADCAVTLASYQGHIGEAMSIGERPLIALVDPAASGRMAVGEAITNIASASINSLNQIKLSANWMAACGDSKEDIALFNTVKAVAMELCPQLGITIPVGKDSLSMGATWRQEGKEQVMKAPLSLIISAFAPVSDVQKSLTPQLQTDVGDTLLLLIDLGQGKNRLGGTALAQVHNQTTEYVPPDLDDSSLLIRFFSAIQHLNDKELLLAYHDRSDGGLFATLCEMAFAGHCGIQIALDALNTDNLLSVLFNEELGAVIQIKYKDQEQVLTYLHQHGLGNDTYLLGNLDTNDKLSFSFHGRVVLEKDRIYYQRIWAETSYHMQSLRDNPDCAQQEFDSLLDQNNPGLNPVLTFNPAENITSPYIATGARPPIAILREQGVNGHIEMAAAFDRAGFTAIDVHMSDILKKRVSLSNFKGLVACGGFSYGDVLGAGRGWANTILMNPLAYDEFATFFIRKDSFALGVCNGCQMFSYLQEIIPGATLWPKFIPNYSGQFEARLITVEVLNSPSLFFQGMENSKIPIVVAHGEGYARFKDQESIEASIASQNIALRFIDNYGQSTENYPFNPNGSPQGITGLTNNDGRFTIMMPHPERVFLTAQYSWCPKNWGSNGPWLRMFQNARYWLG